MSYLSIDSKTAKESELIKALKDIAQYWKENRGACHDFVQGIRYNELRHALEERFKVQAHIDTESHHDDFQLIFDEN